MRSELRSKLRALILLLALAACVDAAAQGDSKPSASHAAPIRLWHALSGVPEQSLLRVVESFNDSQAEFQVIAERKGDYGQTLAAGLAAAMAGKRRGGGPTEKRGLQPAALEGPQLLQVYDAGTADIMASRAYTPLYRLAAATRVAIPDERLNAPGAGAYADGAGRLLAFPLGSATPVLYLNRDTFIRAGLDPDQPPKTWYAMQPVLLSLQAAGSSCPYTTSLPTWVHIENVSAWHNNPLATEDNGLREGRKPELNLNGHLMIRHVSLLTAWFRSELFRYSGRGNEGDQRFASGECAMLTSSSDARWDILGKARFGVKVAQFPYYDDYNDAPYNTLSGGSALWAMAGNSARENLGVARFLAYLATPAVAAQWQQATGATPVTEGAYAALQGTDYFKSNPDMEIALRELRGFRSGAYSRGVRLRALPLIHSILDDELEKVWQGGKAPISALNDAVQRGNVVLREAERAAPVR